MRRKAKIWGMAPETVQLGAAVAIAAGVWVVTHRPPRRSAVAQRNAAVPRPLRRVGPRLRVVDGGAVSEAPEQMALVPMRRDPFQVMLEALFHSEPHGGGFYAVQPGDTPETVARAVLGRVGKYTRQNVLDYIHCFSSSRFNLEPYGSPSTSRAYPGHWLVPGFGQGLRAAFLPRNADALDAIAHGRLPLRSVDRRTAAAQEEHGHLGLLWLPPVSADDLRSGRVTCAHETWSDGSSSIEPPPEFFAFMEAA